MTGINILTAAGFTDIGAQVVRAAAAHQQRYEELRWSGLDDEQARAELEDFLAYAQSMWQPADQLWRSWRIRREPAALKPFTVDQPSLFGHAVDVQAGRAGYWPVALCSCHPAPFPAARDYRRRTRHRRRRR